MLQEIECLIGLELQVRVVVLSPNYVIMSNISSLSFEEDSTIQSVMYIFYVPTRDVKQFQKVCPHPTPPMGWGCSSC